MTKKILTWIKTDQASIKREPSGVWFNVEPFNYQGKNISRIQWAPEKDTEKDLIASKIKELAPDMVQTGWKGNGKMEIELTDSQVQVENNGTLIIREYAPINTVQAWNWPSQFSFELIRTEDINETNGGKKLELLINPIKVDSSAYSSPAINSVIVYCGSGNSGHEYRNRLFLNWDIEIGGKYSMSINNVNNRAKMLDGGRWDLGFEPSRVLRTDKTSSTQPPVNTGNQSNTNTNNNQNQGNENSSNNSSISEDIGEYNKQFVYGNHPTIVKFNELHGKIHDNFEKYQGKSLFSEIDSKEDELGKQGNFRSIWPTDNEVKKQEIKNFNDSRLAKMNEMISLMERLVKETEESGSSPDSKQPGSEEKPEVNNGLKTIREEAIQSIKNALNQEPKVSTSDLHQGNCNWQTQIAGAENANQINAIKWNVLTDITKKRENKQKSSALKDTLQKAKNGSVEDLKKAIKEAEMENGRQSYADNEVEINEFKQKLMNNSPEDYRKMMIEVITETLKNTELTEEELEQEVKEMYRKLTNTETSLDKDELSKLEKEIVPAVNKDGWLKWARKKIASTKEWLRRAEKKVTQEVMDNLRKIKGDWDNFVYDKNVYKENAYQENEKEIKEALTKLEQHLSKEVQNTSTDKTPWKVIIPLSLAGVAVIAMLAAVVVRNRSKRKKLVE